MIDLFQGRGPTSGYSFMGRPPILTDNPGRFQVRPGKGRIDQFHKLEHFRKSREASSAARPILRFDQPGMVGLAALDTSLHPEIIRTEELIEPEE
jgi:hypothetical protein